MNMAWRNEQTREVFYYIALEAWAPDPAAVAREWVESMAFEDACHHLAKQLRIDVGSEGYRSGCGDDLMRALIRPGWKRIDWKQVARHLLQTFGAEVPASPSDNGEQELEA